MSLKNLLVAFTLFSFFMGHAQISFIKSRDHINLTDWNFKKGNVYNAQNLNPNLSGWNLVKIPHTYSMDAIEENGYYRGVVWYQNKTTIPKTMAGKQIFIRFEAVGHEATVYINGKKLGQHSGGYSAFCFNITDYVAFGEENNIAVKVTNEPNFKRIPVTDKLFNIYGGIYRPVQIFATPETHISPIHFASSGVFIKQKNINSNLAKLTLETHIKGTKNQEAQLKYIVKDRMGEIVLEKTKPINFKSGSEIIKEPFEIQSPIFWNGRKNPHIYTIEIELKTEKTKDKVIQNFGIKSYRIDPKKGFYLNGEIYDLHGVAMHQEWKKFGPALKEDNHIKDMDLVDEIGATTLRLSHYQHSETTYNLADEKGILVWSEIPFVHDYSGRELPNAKQQLKELILQNYNHPSIFVWGLWNEVRAYQSPDEPCVQHTKELNELAHSLDKTRLTISASDRGVNSNMGGITDLQAWNKYFGWYTGEYKDLARWLDESNQTKPEIGISISEYGAGGNIFQQDITNLDKPFGTFFPEQDQTYCHEVSWKIIKDRPFVWSSYIWNMFDFSVGDWNRGGIPFTNHKGLITFDRSTKKDAFYFYKANWSDTPVLYIAERRHTKRKNNLVDVKIYTNQDKVTLYVNDKKIAKKKLTSTIHILTFENIKLEEGKNIIKVHSGKSMTDEVEWQLN
ncbi:glycoside hydrolase family 2 TIM barrel-domain containing protein [uncultured Algibacter sp.]|uniref:glycoside hydrolase family 2 protein n=1 Tax=uncultured Algibacter sp. TaxID=298659 RepID=UPI0026026DEF|nr:glycoside hydrolase family 2 TIM barrel-domain containing protein [uncultured Algibacter sp.]